MRGNATVRPEAIVPVDYDESILAVDAIRNWAAAFRFHVNSKGQFSAEAIYAQRGTDGEWDEMGSGGTHGDGWETPWLPTAEGWDGEPLLLMGSSGLDVEDEDERLLSLDATFGFASTRVVKLTVEQDGASRDVVVDSPVGAFVILTVGTGPVTVMAIDRAGKAIGAPLRLAR
jgi:hypothetical protein